MSYRPICVCRCVMQPTGVYHRSLVEGSDALRVEITSTGWSSRRFFLGGRGWLGEETQARYPKTENSADLDHYFWGGAKICFRKNEEMSDLPPAREVPKISKNMTEVYFFDVEEKCAFVYVFQLVLSRLWMRKHPISGRFWNSEDNFENLN